MITRLRTALASAVVFLAPVVAAAADSANAVISNPLKAQSLQALLAGVLQVVSRIGAIFLVLALVYVGFQFAAAQGNEEKLRGARGALMWTIIGGAVLLGAQVIAGVIESTAAAL